MENEVVNTTVVENPVIPEVVEAVNAIEPVQAPQITVPSMPEQKTFIGLDSKTWTDIAVLTGAASAGAILCKAIPWALKKIRNGIETAKSAISMAKNGVNLDMNQTNQAQSATTEKPAQAEESTPAPQENK